MDGDGTLVFVTLSLEEAKDSGAYRKQYGWSPRSGFVLRVASYVKAAVSAHYQCTRNGEVIYWEPSTRDFMAFSIASRTTRTATEFKVPGYEDVTQGCHPVVRPEGTRIRRQSQWPMEIRARLTLSPVS